MESFLSLYIFIIVVLFRYFFIVQFSSLPGVSILGGAIVAIVRIRIILIRTGRLLSYIFRSAIFPRSAERREIKITYIQSAQLNVCSLHSFISATATNVAYVLWDV